jgi:hypothetical protein
MQDSVSRVLNGFGRSDNLPQHRPGAEFDSPRKYREPSVTFHPPSRALTGPSKFGCSESTLQSSSVIEPQTDWRPLTTPPVPK